MGCDRDKGRALWEGGADTLNSALVHQGKLPRAQMSKHGLCVELERCTVVSS